MATIYPSPISPGTQSDAERKLYTAFRDQLDSNYTVIHSVKWISRDPKRYGPVSEIDFVILHPEKGVLVLEVKGGGIHLGAGKWHTVDRFGQKKSLKQDPVFQADKNVYALRDWLSQHDLTRRFSYPVYHAVAFPDIRLKAGENLRPDIPRDIVIDELDVRDLQRVIPAIFDFWRARYPHLSFPGSAGIDGLIKLLVPQRTLKSYISYLFEDEERQIKRLTENQYSILKLLKFHRRASIVGGAGTGKTMLAVELARQRSAASEQVLLLCYNANLAAWLDELTKDTPRITVWTYHHLVNEACKWANLQVHRVNTAPEFEKAPHYLGDALDQIRAIPEKIEKHLFDAVIVDEGQDFEEDYWIPILDLLKDPVNGLLYIFFDDNQRIYAQLQNIPISRDQEPFLLTDNCRNTQHIHNSLQRFTSALNPTECIGPIGRPVETFSLSDATVLQKKLNELADEYGLEAWQIVVLSPSQQGKSQWAEGQRLGRFTLTWDLKKRDKQFIRVSTIHSFKGLESPVIILSELEKAFGDTRNQLVYIGISRARNHLIVLGNLPDSLTRQSSVLRTKPVNIK